MKSPDGHAPVASNREKAKTLIQKDLGVKRVAAWCGVADDTVYQWLSRGTDRVPVPVERAAAIAAAARAEGLEAPLAVLAPTLASALGKPA